VVQKALEVLFITQVLPLVHEFESQVMKCIYDQNGNHVVQKCIEVVSVAAEQQRHAETKHSVSQHIQFIIDEARGQVRLLASHPYGCRVIQRILEYCVSEQRHVVLEEVTSDLHSLIQDQYGNYVVQHVIGHGRDGDVVALIALVQSNLFNYSQHKFASNVVEKCLERGSQHSRKALIDEIVAPGNRARLQQMLRDQYANYVVQKVIDFADDEQMEQLILQVRQSVSHLKHFSYGKHILHRIERVTGKKLWCVDGPPGPGEPGGPGGPPGPGRDILLDDEDDGRARYGGGR